MLQRVGLSLLVFLNFFPPAHGPARYLFFTLFGLAVVVWWRQGRPVGFSTPIDLPLLCFAGWILVTIPFSVDPAYSFREWRKLAAQVLLFYWTVMVLRADRHDRAPREVLLALSAGTAVTALYALTQVAFQAGPWTREGRPGAVGSDYNWLSTYMVMAIPLTLAAAMLVRAQWLKGLGFATTALAFAAEVAALTRAGWVGLVAEAVAGLWLAGRRKLLVGLVVLMASAAVGLVLTLPPRTHNETADVADPWTLEARLEVWKLAAADLLEHPFVGIGYGNYNFVTRYAGHPALEKAHGPHSTFVVVGLGSGLPALIAFLWLLATVYLTLTKPLRAPPPPGEQPLERTRALMAFAVAVMLVGFAVRNVFDYMLVGALANLFWMFVAVGLHVSRPGAETGSETLCSPAGRLPHASASQQPHEPHPV